MEINKIYNEDCLETMNRIPDEFIDLVVTSPPYDLLRDYKGYKFEFEKICDLLYKKMKMGGVVVWVVGDSVNKGNQSGNSFRQALYFQSIGFNLYDTIIYKNRSGGNPHKNRYINCFQYMFIFTKDKPKTVNLLLDRPNKSAGRKTGKYSVREKDGSLTDKQSREIKPFGVRYNIWEYAVGKGVGQSNVLAYQHPATFPEQLAEDHILSWSNLGDLIYDPMCGSGTTLRMAKKLNRNFLGSEISSEYCKIANELLS